MRKRGRESERERKREREREREGKRDQWVRKVKLRYKWIVQG